MTGCTKRVAPSTSKPSKIDPEPFTPEEDQASGAGQPGALQIALEQLKGKNRLAAVQAKSQGDITKSLADQAIERGSASVPLERAQALNERTSDVHMLQEGVE